MPRAELEERSPGPDPESAAAFSPGRLMLSLLFGVLVLAVLAVWTGPADFAMACRQIPGPALPIALLFTVVNYLLRFWRWQLYLRALDIRLPWVRSLAIFLAGMLMSISPGKLGEVLKSLLLKVERRVPVTRSAPIVFAERLTDLLAVLLLCLAGLSIGEAQWPLLVGGLLLFVLAFLAVGSPSVARLLVRLAGRHGARVDRLFSSARQLLQPRPNAAACLLALAAWFAESVGLHLLVRPFLPELPLTVSIHIYALATLAGALSMLPGGLAATEGGLYLLLSRQGLASAPAATVTFLIRVITLWFAVLLGFIMMMTVFPPSELQAGWRKDGRGRNGDESAA